MGIAFTSEQIKTISGIFANLGNIFFASIVIPFIATSQSPDEILLLLSGVSVAITLWVISITLVKEI